jgi:hypothetical protein
MGDVTFDVSVRDASGAPVTDGEVSVTLFMAAMPSMNMPALRNSSTLQHIAGGVYRGTGQIVHSGRWDVTVAVMRRGQRLGSRELSLVAR